MKYDLSKLASTSKPKGLCTTIHGQPGIGKSTLAANIALQRDGIYILGEDGISSLGIDGFARTDIIEKWEDFQDILNALVMDEHKFKTVIIDTIDSLMTPLTTYVVNKYYEGNLTLANAFRNYYTELYSEFGKVLNAFNVLMRNGMDIVLISHTLIEDYKSPDSEPYKHHTINLPGGQKKNLSSLLYDFSDNVLYARRETKVIDGKGIGGTRILETDWHPAFDAKSRVKCPEQLSLDVAEFIKYFTTK